MSEFFLCEIENIEKSGVEIKVTGTRFKKDDDDDCIRTVRTVCFDFTKHDKVFEDKIAELENIINHKLGGWDKHGITYQEILDMKAENQELKQRISELESMKMENFSEIDTSNPLACAESIIEHMTHCEKFMIMPERDVQTFSVEELKEIADYLMVYYKHHKYRDEEDTISF